MKIILFDILKNSKKTIKVEKYIYSFGESIYVYLNENIIEKNNIVNKFKNIIITKYLSYFFKSKKFDESNYLYITSYEFDKNKDLKENLKNILDDRFIEIVGNDTIQKNSIKYLQSYSNESKILCIISKKIDITILLSYIEKFKIVDILYLGKKDANFFKRVHNINIEYGSTVSFINAIDITFYDAYILFDDVDLSGYILNKKAKCLDLTSSDNDIYSQEYKLYNKYSNELINKESYSKTRLGKLINKYLTNSV